jgi:hypothetical protein
MEGAPPARQRALNSRAGHSRGGGTLTFRSPGTTHMLIMWKLCVTCHQWKSQEAFSRWRYSKDGLQARCKDCAAKYYAANRDRLIPGIKDRRRRAVREARIFVRSYFLGHPCVDCGESDPVVLDFDHVTGKKRKNVSNLAGEGASIEALKEEIAKCVVRCANCHRRRTALQLGYYKGLTTVTFS